MMPKTSEEVTPEWLNEVLDDSITGGAQVSSIEKEIIGEGAGFLGELARLALTYDREAPAAPSSMVVKLPTQDESVRNLAQLINVYEREIRFYEQIADEMPMRTPRCYFSHADVAKGDYVLLLEDLAPGSVSDVCAMRIRSRSPPARVAVQMSGRSTARKATNSTRPMTMARRR